MSKAWRVWRICFIISIMALALNASAPLFAQVSPEEHKSHHPEEAGSAEGEDSAAEGKGKGGMMAGKGGMMGGKGGMGGMMEKMGAPKERELYPELMRLHDLPMEKRAEVQAKAHARMKSGVELISKGVATLSDSAATDDFAAMQLATDSIRQGVADFDSGLAAHRALAEGGEPRNVALTWFRKEMNLVEDSQMLEHQQGIFGMSVFHFSLMVLLIVFTVVVLWMYFFKMRRAANLLKEMGSTGSKTLPTSGVQEKTGAAAPQVMVSVPSSKPKSSPVDPPEFPAMKSLTEPAKKWSGRLQVSQIFDETPGVKTYWLDAENQVALPFTYYPGQFITLAFEIEGKTVKRSYTIATTPTQLHYCGLTIKREDQGIVSRYMHDQIKEGDFIEVSGPNGKFVFTGEESDSIVLIGGGVGITPLMSVIRYLTDIGWHGEIFLLYCCRTTNDFIYRSELEQLQERHANLNVFATMTRAEGTVWMGLKGRFNSQVISHLVPDIANRRIHICGPPGLMGAMTDILDELKVPEKQIFTEAFGPAKKSPPKANPEVETVKEGVTSTEDAVETSATVNFITSGKIAQMDSEQTVLEAAEAVDVEIDSSCLSGQCGLCKVKLLSGNVTMDCDDALDDEEKAEGIILACQGKAQEDIEIEA